MSYKIKSSILKSSVNGVYFVNGVDQAGKYDGKEQINDLNAPDGRFTGTYLEVIFKNSYPVKWSKTH